VLLPHPFDLVAILIGIFLALRRSELAGEEGPADEGRRLAFELFRAHATAAYTLGIRVCFFKVVADFSFSAYLHRYQTSLWLARTLGISLDLLWVLALVVCWIRTRRAARERQSLSLDQSLDAGPSA
jgi:hypothetical protein